MAQITSSTSASEALRTRITYMAFLTKSAQPDPNQEGKEDRLQVTDSPQK